MAKLALLLAPFAALLAAAPAHATIVYVKGAASIYSARDDGSAARRLATGGGPVISPNGRWVAYVRPHGRLEEVRIVRARGGSSRRLMRSVRVDALRFSPDSSELGAVLANRLRVRDIPTATTFTAATGSIRGFSFSPDSKSIVWARAATRADLDAPADLYRITFDAGPKRRLTTDRRSLNPLWTSAGIVFDKQTVRPGDEPAYDIYEMRDDGTGVRRVTTTAVPQFQSGLVPLQRAGGLLLAGFVGQELNVAYRVDLATGAAAPLGATGARGLVPGGLSRDGTRALAVTGGLNPADRHDVVTLPFTGGPLTTLVRRASSPSWTG